ncbi:clavesin-1-like [Arctopsyche grandis]|uniref:clavesin-1-like n=1 Tax=Arctopsyche grandis TaxID=121162 RepID=UPI00406D7622
MSKGLRIETDPLRPETMKIAEEQLRETPERVKEATEKLRELLHADRTIHYRDDDEFLLIFLRPCKFYPESALEFMRRIAEFKKNNSDILANLMPEDERDAFVGNDVVNILKDRDQKGRRVLIVNVGGIWDTKRVSADQLFRVFYLIHEAAILEPETQVNGVVVIMNFDGMGMKQVKELGPTFSRRLLSFIQDAMPVRLKEVHFINEPWIFNMVWQLFKPLVRTKLRGRMFFHKANMTSLHKHLDPKFLPTNYGGELPEMNYTSADWFPCVEIYLDHIQKWNSYGFVNNQVKQ